jgi:cell division transport system ATP-binding protein
MGTTVVIATHNENLIQRFNHPVIHLAGGDTIPASEPRREADSQRAGEA